MQQLLLEEEVAVLKAAILKQLTDKIHLQVKSRQVVVEQAHQITLPQETQVFLVVQEEVEDQM